jgi:hypothetical protein
MASALLAWRVFTQFMVGPPPSSATPEVQQQNPFKKTLFLELLQKNKKWGPSFIFLLDSFCIKLNRILLPQLGALSQRS